MFFWICECHVRFSQHSMEFFWSSGLLLWFFNVKVAWAIKESCSPLPLLSSPQIMLTIEPKIVNEFWACSPISYLNVSFLHPFLDRQLITHHSNYRWPIETSNSSRHVSLNILQQHIESYYVKDTLPYCWHFELHKSSWLLDRIANHSGLAIAIRAKQTLLFHENLL